MNKGQVPPSFTLKDQDGKPVSLSKFKGRPVVVYFYPADETPGCTKQVREESTDLMLLRDIPEYCIGIFGQIHCFHDIQLRNF